MELASLDLNLLTVFEAVFDARSVTRAAEHLGVSQPTLSAALSRLRAAFNDPLFVRAGGAMQPTPRAIIIAPRVATALAELRATLLEQPFVAERSSRSFVVASTDYTTAVVLPEVIATLRREAPGVTLRVIGYDKGDVPLMLDKGAIDVALGVFRPPPEAAVRQLLCAERFVGLVRSDHPALKSGKISLEAFTRADHALVSVRRDGRGEIDLALSKRGLERRVAVVMPHMLCLPAVLAQTDLMAALPARIANSVLDRGLALFELPVDVPPWRIEMLWNPVTRTDPAAAWFRSKLLAAARSVDARTKPAA